MVFKHRRKRRLWKRPVPTAIRKKNWQAQSVTSPKGIRAAERLQGHVKTAANLKESFSIVGLVQRSCLKTRSADNSLADFYRPSPLSVSGAIIVIGSRKLPLKLDGSGRETEGLSGLRAKSRRRLFAPEQFASAKFRSSFLPSYRQTSYSFHGTKKREAEKKVAKN